MTAIVRHVVSPRSLPSHAALKSSEHNSIIMVYSELLPWLRGCWSHPRLLIFSSNEHRGCNSLGDDKCLNGFGIKIT